jgi:hypothetical protein
MHRRKFLGIASTVGILSPIINLKEGLLPAIWQHQEKLRVQSIAAFNRFEEVWNFNDFWKRGNTFDACLNFADALYNKWPADAEVMAMEKRVGEMLQENLAYFASFDPGGLWADDFGWWGLMALNANKHLLRLNNKELAEKYTGASMQCWLQMKNHAYDFSDSAKPVPHGCRNGDANGQNKGVKNTVTNALMFLLSTRSYRQSIRSDKNDFLEMAYREWVWFDSWFKLEKYEYLKKLTGGGALVQERPMAIFEGSDYQDATHPTWEKGWVWSGDQGMLLAALSDMVAMKNEIAAWVKEKNIDPSFSIEAFERKAHSYINLLSKGIQLAMVGESDGLIREAPLLGNFGPAFGNDYLAGRGIMMRYLGKLQKEFSDGHLTKNIADTAEAIWQTRNMSTNQFQPEYTSIENDKLYVNQFRKLAGVADDVHKWNISAMNEQQKFGVCQSIGLDALGASINRM